jgi:two-component system cell cycle response regulator DivK
VKTILLIEDDVDSARITLRSLRPDGYRLLHALDAATGLEMARKEKPDLILLDLGLPDLEGQTLASLIRRSPGLEQVILIAVTAWPPGTARQMTRAYGCDGYISKPIRPLTFPVQIAGLMDQGSNG